MSSYYDDDRRRHGGSRNYEPEYVEETTYISRGSRAPATELVYRTREDSVEDIPRTFAPGSEYRRSTYRDDDRSRRTRSQGNRGYYDDGYDDYSEYGPPAGRRRRDDDYYSDDYSRSERPKERRKSKVEELAEGVGLGGLVAAVTNGGKSRSRRGSRSDSSEDHSTRSRSQETRRKWQQAAKAAVITGVIEAVRSRNEPGGWAGPKGQRALTAALGAAAVDGFVDRDPEKKSTRHIIEAVVGGLAANRLANGPREQGPNAGRGRSLSRGRSEYSGDSRSRSRSGLSIRDRFRSLSRGRSASRGPDGEPRKGGNSLKEIAAIGGVAAVGKAIYDRVRSKSRGRTDRSESVGSEDSYVPNRRQRYRNRDRDDNEGSRDIEANDDNRVARRRDRENESGGGEVGAIARKKRDSSSDSVSTTDLENQRKKNKRSELLTAGLATVATIHAAHGVYSSMVASEKRRKLVSEGEMSTEEARKRKSKNMMQDVAAVGIAALGIKSAFSEWKEMNEQRHEVLELEQKKRKRTKKREKREREMKEQRENQQYGRGDDPGYPYIPQGALGPSSYADGNPYAASAAAGRYV